MIVLLIIFLLNPFFLVLASQLNANAKEFIIDDKSALNLCINGKSLDEVESLAIVSHPTKISLASKSSGTVFAHLRQGWSLAEETETETAIEFSSEEQVEFDNEPDLYADEYYSYDCQHNYFIPEGYTLPENSFYYPDFYDYEISYKYLIYNHQHSTYDQDHLGYNSVTQAAFAYEIVYDSYTVHRLDTKDIPGITVDRLRKLMDLPRLIYKRVLFSRNFSCFLISESYSSHSLVHDKVIGSKYFSFRVFLSNTKIRKMINCMFWLLKRNEVFASAIMAHHLKFKKSDPFFTWTIFLKDEYEHILVEFHDQFSKLVEVTEVKTWPKTFKPKK